MLNIGLYFWTVELIKTKLGFSKPIVYKVLQIGLVKFKIVYDIWVLKICANVLIGVGGIKTEKFLSLSNKLPN